MHDYPIGTKLKHVAYNGDIVEILERLPNERYLILRPGRRTKVGTKTLNAEYSLNLEAPLRRGK